MTDEQKLKYWKSINIKLIQAATYSNFYVNTMEDPQGDTEAIGQYKQKTKELLAEVNDLLEQIESL